MAPTAEKSVIGIASLPNQRHRIVTKRGANFTIMVCGESGVGKTTFVNTLFTTEVKEPKNLIKTSGGSLLRHSKQFQNTVEIEITKAELEENGFQVNLTVIDTPGFGDYVNNKNSWMPIVEFIDDQHEDYHKQEIQPVRHEINDRRVHACLYFIRPNGHTLTKLDVKAMKELGSRVNLIPVIAKADTLTPKDLAQFKQNILEAIHFHEIQVYQCPHESDNEIDREFNESINNSMPFAIIGSVDTINVNGREVKGRQYSWGVAEVENDEHCDFNKLRNLLIRMHMHDLISTTEERQYQQFLLAHKEMTDGIRESSTRYIHLKFKKEEDNLREDFTKQVKEEEERFRAWEKDLVAKRDDLNKDLEQIHQQIRSLEVDCRGLQEKNNGSPHRSFSRR